MFLINASECKGTSGDAPALEWNPKLYSGDSRTLSYVRQDGDHIEQVYCSSPDFDKMVVMESTEIRKAKKAYYDVINQCEKWRQAPIY